MVGAIKRLKRRIIFLRLDPYAGWDLWCDPVGGNLPRGLGLRSRGRKAPPREAVGRAGGGCREGVAPSRQGGPGV
jgi:hypothetical protein